MKIGLKSYLKPSRHLRIFVTFFILLLISILVMLFLINDRRVFLDSFLGSLLGLAGAFIIYELSLHIGEINNRLSEISNTKFVYGMYKIEIEANTKHLDNLEDKGWVPFYRLQTSSRDKLWGELANYSKDFKLIKRINDLYREYELINNKIDIMNAVILQLNIRPNEESLCSGQVLPDYVYQLRSDLRSQFDTCVKLGGKANKMAKECLDLMNKHLGSLEMPN